MAAISIASRAGWRVTAETMPSPTGSARVAARAAVALDIAPARKPEVAAS